MVLREVLNGRIEKYLHTAVFFLILVGEKNNGKDREENCGKTRGKKNGKNRGKTTDKITGKIKRCDLNEAKQKQHSVYKGGFSSFKTWSTSKLETR